MKKIAIILVLGFLLLCGSETGAQFAEPPDSSDVAGWEFTTFTDVDDTLTDGHQIYQKIDSTTAVIDSAVGAERAATTLKADSALAFTHQGIKKFHADSTSESFVFSDVFRITSADVESMYMSKQYIDDGAAGLAEQGVKGDHVDSTLEDFVFDGAYHKTSAEADSQFMSKKYIDDASGGLVAQSVKGDHVDSTLEDFVFDGAYHKTSAEADSAYLTHGGAAATYVTATLTEEQVEDFVGGMLGGTETGIAVTYEDGTNDIDFVVDSEPWDSLTAWANKVNAAACSLIAWGNMVNASTDTIGDWTSLVNEAKDSLTAWANLVNEAADSLISWANKVNAHQDTIGDWTALVNEAKDSLTSWANKVNTVYDWGDHSGQNYLDEDDLGNWKVYYGNGTGVFTELTLGADGTYLKSNGATSAPTFATPPGGDPGSAINDSVTYGYQIYQKIDSTTAKIPAAESADTTTAEFLHKEGGTITGNITMPDDGWIGLGSGKVGIEFLDETLDTVRIWGGALRAQYIYATTLSTISTAIIGNGLTVTTGTVDLTGTSVNLPSDAVNASSEIATQIIVSDDVDSTDEDFVFDGAYHKTSEIGDSAYVSRKEMRSRSMVKSFVIQAIDSDHDIKLWKTSVAITIDSVFGQCTAGTNVIGALDEYDWDNTDLVAIVNADWTFTTTYQAVGSFTNAGIAAKNHLKWHTTSVSGTVNFFDLTIWYHED